MISTKPCPLCRRYVKEDGNSASLHLEHCLDPHTGQVQEPLPHLLMCALRCVHAYTEALAAESLPGADESLLNLKKLMNAVSNWLANLCVDDFELGKCGGRLARFAQICYLIRVAGN